MKRISLLLVTIALLMFASSALAAGYGTAGCGLGSVIFGDMPGGVQILAATTNGSSDSQLLGITSGTSNCDATGLVLAKKEQEVFVKNNYESLLKEMARGEGETLAALANLFGCPVTKYQRFGELTRENYQVIIQEENEGPGELLRNLREKVSIDPMLTNSCGRVTL